MFIIVIPPPLHGLLLPHLLVRIYPSATNNINPSMKTADKSPTFNSSGGQDPRVLTAVLSYILLSYMQVHICLMAPGCHISKKQKSIIWVTCQPGG